MKPVGRLTQWDFRPAEFSFARLWQAGTGRSNRQACWLVMWVGWWVMVVGVLRWCFGFKTHTFPVCNIYVCVARNPLRGQLFFGVGANRCDFSCLPCQMCTRFGMLMIVYVYTKMLGAWRWHSRIERHLYITPCIFICNKTWPQLHIQMICSIESILTTCRYEVLTCNEAIDNAAKLWSAEGHLEDHLWCLISWKFHYETVNVSWNVHYETMKLCFLK